jgi:hypothetical protein
MTDAWHEHPTRQISFLNQNMFEDERQKDNFLLNSLVTVNNMQMQNSSSESRLLHSLGKQYMHNMTCVLSPPSAFCGVRVSQSFIFYKVFCRSLFVFLFFSFYSLFCLSLFDLIDVFWLHMFFGRTKDTSHVTVKRHEHHFDIEIMLDTISGRY